MAHLWIRDASSQWAALPLTVDVVDLKMNPPAAAPGPPAHAAVSAAQLLRSRRGDPVDWLLVAGVEAGVSVNGWPSLIGLHILADRDEIRMEGVGTVFFSAETLPAVEKFQGSERRIVCPRCKLAVEAGADAVRCPHCGVWHHQAAERPCFTYDEKCAACGNSSDLDGGYRWVPGD